MWFINRKGYQLWKVKSSQSLIMLHNLIFKCNFQTLHQQIYKGHQVLLPRLVHYLRIIVFSVGVTKVERLLFFMDVVSSSLDHDPAVYLHKIKVVNSMETQSLFHENFHVGSPQWSGTKPFCHNQISNKWVSFMNQIDVVMYTVIFNRFHRQQWSFRDISIPLYLYIYMAINSP